MSNCMTIADETVDQKDTCTEIAPKDIVDFILEELLLSAFIVSDKGCSRIGDFTVTEEFRQQYDQLQHPKDFEQVDHTQNQESTLDSGENVDLSGKENLELIIGSFVKQEEKLHPAGECTVINEDVLANNELQIQNGQIYLGKSKGVESSPEPPPEPQAETRFVPDGKIEIEYLSEGKLNKIYVPLNPSERDEPEGALGLERESGEDAPPGKREEETAEPDPSNANAQLEGEDPERPFKPFTTEELRQVWRSGNSSLVGNWEGDALGQREEAVRLMVELSSVHVFPDGSADPKRPRACAFDEEDVKKIIKEIEEISFTQCHANTEDSDVTYHSEGQGDADLESKPSLKSKGSSSKAQKPDKEEAPLPDFIPNGNATNRDEVRGAQEHVNSSQSKMFFSDVAPAATSSSLGNAQKAPDDDSVVRHPLRSEGILAGEQDPPREEAEGESPSFWSFDECRSLERGGPGGGGVQPPGHSFGGTKSNVTCSSFLVLDESLRQNGSDGFFTDSLNVKGFQGDRNTWEFFPDTMSLSGNTGSLSGSKLDEYMLKNADFTSELDVRTFQGRQLDVAKGSRSVNDTQEITPELTNQIQQEKDLDSNLIVRKTGEIRKSQDPGNFLQGSSESWEMPKNGQHSDLIGKGFDQILEGDGKLTGGGSVEEEGQPVAAEGTNQPLVQNETSSNNSFCKEKEKEEESRNGELEEELLPPSQVSDNSLNESEPDEETETSGTCVQNFRLHSQKMCWGPNWEMNGQTPKEFRLTESKEAFIDMTESVIQIIEPPENAKEASEKVSFSLLSEAALRYNDVPQSEPAAESNREQDFSEIEIKSPPKRVYSGMTTIGPMKNFDHDPKDLAAPEIDYGKMTRITSSRQLAKDLALFSSDVTTIKILEEDDSDEDDDSMNAGEDPLERTSLVNRDIASLTKVQKIREVISYQPKPEEDFEDDDALSRPRLDLKDVESMADDRYKVTDVGIPLLSFEIGEGSLDESKDLIDSIGLVINGLTNPNYYGAEIEEDGEEVEGSQGDPVIEYSSKMDKESLKTEAKEKEEEEEDREISLLNVERSRKSNLELSDEGEEGGSRTSIKGSDAQQKYGTLGSVFRKASTKFMRKDSDLFVRNSKSLPRDTSRISATESIRSILDECQSSATNMLKKSRSLLKNTQGILKSISQSRMTSESGAGRGPENQKRPCPSESDVNAIERKFSGFLKKEDFAAAKNLFKTKIEKTFKSFESKSSEPETSAEKEELQVALRNKENLQVDRIENFKKLLPKSPLVYKSQFVKSKAAESAGPPPGAEGVEPEKNAEEPSTGSPSESAGKESGSEEQENGRAYFQENLRWVWSGENVGPLTVEEMEPQQPEFIVMETVQGLPTSDLESPSSEKENLNVENTGKTETGEEEKDFKVEASNSLQAFSGGGFDVAPCFPEVDEERIAAKPPSSERKIKTKKKKFTTRFRSFWCSAFGRLKTPPSKGDLP